MEKKKFNNASEKISEDIFCSSVMAVKVVVVGASSLNINILLLYCIQIYTENLWYLQVSH